MCLASRVYEATPALAASARGDADGEASDRKGGSGKEQWEPTVDGVAATAQALQARWRQG